MQPIRHGMIRKYLEKYKYQKKKRDSIIKTVEATEDTAREVLGD